METANQQPEVIWNRITEEVKLEVGGTELEVQSTNKFQFRLIWKLEKEGKHTKRLNQLRAYLNLLEKQGRTLPEEQRKELRASENWIWKKY